MSHFLKSIALSIALSVSASAQWGAVTSQPDTNRFINSQQDFGLVMPHQQVIVGLLDTTITSVGIGGGNASKVIVGSLLDHEDNCANYTITNGVASCAGSYEKWRELEKSTSWYQAARGDTTAMFPTNYAITVSVGQDSVVVWNRDTAEMWMALREAASVILGDGAINDIAFKDMILYVGTQTQIYLVDFAADKAHRHGVSGRSQYLSNIHGREGAEYTSPIISTLSIANDDVNSVAVVRDPFGLKDALGRPKHWWGVGTGSASQSTSYYNPHDNTIKNRQATVSAAQDIVYTKTGIYYSWEVDGVNDSMYLGKSPFAHHQNPEYTLLWNGGSGAGKLAWAATGNATRIAASEGQSILGRNADLIHFASNAGVYNFHSSTQNGNDQGHYAAKQRFSSTVNAPVEFGDAVLALALEDNTTDSSPYGNTMTATGSPGTVAAVFGNGYDGGASKYLSHVNDADFNLAANTGIYAQYWMKAATDDADDTHFQLDVNGGAPYFYVVFDGDGTLSGEYRDSATVNASCASTGDLSDGAWHHIAAVWDGVNVFRLYTDGVENCNDTGAATAATSFEDLFIGTNGGFTSRTFDGSIDDFSMGHGQLHAEAVAKLHAEGRKKLAMGTPVFTRTTDDALISNNVVDIDALDNGIWTVAFSDANTVQVFDGRIPIQQIAAPAGTVKSVALIQSPGTDSVGVAIGTTTNLKFVQPSINLREAMAHQYQEPIFVGSPVVVDSTGVGGIFWTGDDAIDAGANANRSHIKFATGTYGKFSADQDGQWIQGSGQGHTYTLGGAPTTLIDGGTSGHAIDVSGVGVVLSDLSAQTDEGAGNAFSAIHLSGGQNQVVRDIIIPESDLHGISQTAIASTSLFTNIRVYDADNYAMLLQGGASQAIGNFVGSAGADGIYVGGVRMVVEGNYINPNTHDGIRCDSAGDNSVFVGNLIHDGGGITLNSGCDYSIVDGNASDGGVSNNGSNNVIGDNVTY